MRAKCSLAGVYLTVISSNRWPTRPTITIDRRDVATIRTTNPTAIATIRRLIDCLIIEPENVFSFCSERVLEMALHPEVSESIVPCSLNFSLKNSRPLLIRVNPQYPAAKDSTLTHLLDSDISDDLRHFVALQPSPPISASRPIQYRSDLMSICRYAVITLRVARFLRSNL